MPTWVIVEDEPAIQDVISAMFGIWGVDGIAFGDGMDVVKWLDGLSPETPTSVLPDLAIVDIRLPTISGVEVAWRLRNCPYLERMAIVLITAYRLTTAQEQQVLTMSQADGLIYKPLPTMDKLRHLLDELVTCKRFGVDKPALIIGQ